MSNRNISRLTLSNCQIKSADILRDACRAIDALEKLTFIRSGEIKFEDNFICPDIDLLPFYNSADPTEKMIGRLCIALHVKRYGKHSNPGYMEIMKNEREVLKKYNK